MEFLIEVIIEIILFGFISFPGAVILYFWKGKKTKFSELWDKQYWKCVGVGLIFWAVIISAIVLIS
ncbi:hypothetical protein N9544_01385 [Flavobacteriales bacterium]|nr:hypothetical protein [Flavobacteriales bacterium]